MKLASLFTLAALVAFVSFLASLVAGAGALIFFAVFATCFVLAGACTDYGRAPRPLIAYTDGARVHVLRLAA